MHDVHREGTCSRPMHRKETCLLPDPPPHAGRSWLRLYLTTPRSSSQLPIIGITTTINPPNNGFANNFRHDGRMQHFFFCFFLFFLFLFLGGEGGFRTKLRTPVVCRCLFAAHTCGPFGGGGGSSFLEHGDGATRASRISKKGPAWFKWSLLNR